MSVVDLLSLSDKRVLVTGGSRGLGLGMARGMREAGATVAIMSRTAEQVHAAASEISALPLVADANGDPAQILTEAEELLGGGIDCVVHAAGIQHRAAAEEFPAEEWDNVLRTNLTAPFRLSQELGRRQLQAGCSGSHIFIGSLTSTLSIRGIAAYTASKSAIYGVIRSLSTEWAGRGIRVNGIAPGYFRTNLTESVFSDPETYANMLRRIPMERFGDPKELAGPAVFLASDAASYITGQLITVDGGWTAA